MAPCCSLCLCLFPAGGCFSCERGLGLSRRAFSLLSWRGSPYSSGREQRAPCNPSRTHASNRLHHGCLCFVGAAGLPARRSVATHGRNFVLDRDPCATDQIRRGLADQPPSRHEPNFISGHGADAVGSGNNVTGVCLRFAVRISAGTSAKRILNAFVLTIGKDQAGAYPCAFLVCKGGDSTVWSRLGFGFISGGRGDVRATTNSHSTLVRASHPWLRQEWGTLFLVGLRFSSQRARPAPLTTIHETLQPAYQSALVSGRPL